MTTGSIVSATSRPTEDLSVGIVGAHRVLIDDTTDAASFWEPLNARALTRLWRSSDPRRLRYIYLSIPATSDAVRGLLDEMAMLTFPERHPAKLKGSILNNVYCAKPDGKESKPKCATNAGRPCECGFSGRTLLAQRAA
jgi:hypothetical protein